MQYKILRDTNLKNMEDLVNQHIAVGWKLFSDLKIILEVSQNPKTFTYFQAVIKIDELIN